MVEKPAKAAGENKEKARSSHILEWVKVLLPVFVSWPVVGLVIALLFHEPIDGLIDRFSQSNEGTAEFGPLKIALGPPVLPPQYRSTPLEQPLELIDLSTSIGDIGDTGPEGTTVGFSVAYAIQAETGSSNHAGPAVSPRGIYELAKKYDEYPGEQYEGSSIIGALMGAKAVGVYSQEDWPYSSTSLPDKSIKPLFKIKGFNQTKTVSQILQALREGKVVVAAIEVTNDFNSPSEKGKVTLKLPMESKKYLGTKTVTIVGYNSQTAEFKFANDWGTNWGEDGFGLIKDSDLSEILVDGYTVNL